MENHVSIRFCGQIVVPNQNGELEFETGAGTKTKIPADELHTRLLQAQSFGEVEKYLKNSGAYIGSENSNIIIAETSNGTQIFSKDEPSRKIVIDKSIPESALEQILSINDYDNVRAVEKILIENGVIEDTEKEAEIINTFERDNLSFEQEADNVDSRDISDGGEIGASRLQRDMIENTNSGIISEEERRRIDEERLKKIKEGRAAAHENEGIER